LFNVDPTPPMDKADKGVSEGGFNEIPTLPFPVTLN
jgi:hypothetical protein